ncbi:MAG: DUF2442 domain-containing protein [Candidatus Gracilibacteria bacterium]|nr:DUF2442 domain-containing protein [Candidatus Gracilibacteria bacterium]
MHFVKEASYIGEYNIKITFEDGNVKVFDMSPYLENNSLTFRPLKQKDIFKMFKIKGNTISWITGADISPDFLYEKGINNE